MPNYNPKIENLIPFTGKDDPRRASGRPKGIKSLKTILTELEDEDYDWSKIPSQGTRLDKYLKKAGSPWRAIVTRAMLDAVNGDRDAREWLTKISYGKEIGNFVNEREIIEPIIISNIQPRNTPNDL